LGYSEGYNYSISIDTENIIDMSLIIVLLTETSYIENKIRISIDKSNIELISKDYIENKLKKIKLSLFKTGCYLSYKSKNLLYVSIYNWAAYGFLYSVMFRTGKDLLNLFIKNF